MKHMVSDDKIVIDTIRTLAMDAVERANSGHPGTAMALAPVAYVLWSRFLKYDPDVPDWPNRDRFVLSIGHASMLLYAILHLAAVKTSKDGSAAISLDDIRRFRQMSSRTPGHPEYRFTTGVETTTGPLGQGCGNSVGMALAARHLAARYNRPEAILFDHDVYVLCGDGDMMEGVTSEAASLAGHLRLSNLCWIYDSNKISIEGNTELAFTENVGARFRSYGWHVEHVPDANDLAKIVEKLENFQNNRSKPTLIIVESIIGWGSPKAGSEKAHGEALGPDAVAQTKRFLDWPESPDFHVPDGVQQKFAASIVQRSRPLREAWEVALEKYKSIEPLLGLELPRLFHGLLPDDWDASHLKFEADSKGLATRDAGGKALNAFAQKIPWLAGGAADLSPSTKTTLVFPGAGSLGPETQGGRNIHFGVREHAMGAIANGLALSYLRPFTATFLVFSDYMRPAIRLAALMELPVVFFFTQD
jgi:transketolase